MLGSPISDYDWNKMRRAQNDYAASQLGHPVEESDIHVGYGGAIPGAGAEDSGGIADQRQPALAGLMRGLGSGNGSSRSAAEDGTLDGNDWLKPFGGDRYLASTAHDLAATKNVDALNRLKYPAAYADDERGMQALDVGKAARTKNDIDATSGEDMAMRALQRQVHGMGVVDEEKSREAWSPMNQGLRAQKIQDTLDLAQPQTDRVAAAADAKVKAAIAAANAQIEAAQARGDGQRVAALTAARAKLLTSQYGDTDAQMAELDRLSAPLNGLLGATGGGEGVGTYPPDVEAKIAGYVKAGANRADSIAHLKQTGDIK